MDDSDYRAFLDYVFEGYVRIDGDETSHISPYSSLYQSLRRSYKFINAMDTVPEDVYGVLRAERIRQLLSDISRDFIATNRILDKTGFQDALDAHYDELVEGLALKHFPAEDFRILEDLGSRNPQRDLRAVIFLLKARKDWNRGEQTRIRSQLSRIEEQLKEERVKISKGSEIPVEARKNRRWFKGLGQIAQGAALSVANVALAAGWTGFSVSVETQSWGALVSVTTGVGMVSSGAGDLRGE